MAKKASTLTNMVLTLGAVCLVSSALLGAVYRVTAGPKAAAELVKKTFAIGKVLPAFDNTPYDDMFKIPSADGGDSLVCYIGRMDGREVGTAVQTWTMKGFNGLVRLMVGFDAEGKIYNISVLEQKETAGLGARMTEAAFLDQFRSFDPGAQPLRVRQDGGTVDALSAATISSRAFCDAVQRAYDSYLNHKKGPASDAVSGAIEVQ